jgi:hypothetical protein
MREVFKGELGNFPLLLYFKEKGGVLRFVFEGVDKKQTDTAYQNMLIVCFFYFKLYYTIGKIC